MSDTQRIGTGSPPSGAIERPRDPKHIETPHSNGDGHPPRGLSSWIEARTGALTWLRETFNPPIRGGARWHYAIGAALVSGIAIEAITGLLLLSVYSPSTSTAWGSVYFIHEELWGGWIVRGLHSFGAHALVVLSVFLLLQKLLTGAYRAPRELSWWVAVGLAFAIVGGTLTGNALVWDQDGYWGWSVETGIAGGAPVVGPIMQRLIVGGTEFGNATLGRLFGLHVGLIPIALIVLVLARWSLARRHGPPVAPRRAGEVEPAWPRQTFYNLVATALFVAAVVAVMLTMGGPVLEAPADPSSNYPARPAWFFLWLYELRKSFPGPQEIIATVVVPGALATVLLLLPFLDRIFPRRLAHLLACAFLFTVIGGAGFLTAEAIRADLADPEFTAGLADAEIQRERAITLARAEGVPPEGASALLARDPLTRGRALLTSKCLGCHAFGGQTAATQDEHGEIHRADQVAPDLKGYGSRAWLRGLLAEPASDTYFGTVPECGAMARWRQKTKLTGEQLDQIADFFELHVMTIPADLPASEWESLAEIYEHPGMEAFNAEGECASCHVTIDWSSPNDEAPNLYGWGTPWYIERMIRRPGAPHNYGYLDESAQMPGFEGQLTAQDLRTIVRYLKGDYLGADAASTVAP